MCRKSFCCFLLEVPTDFRGVQTIVVTSSTLRLSEKGSERKFEALMERKSDRYLPCIRKRCLLVRWLPTKNA